MLMGKKRKVREVWHVSQCVNRIIVSSEQVMMVTFSSAASKTLSLILISRPKTWSDADQWWLLNADTLQKYWCKVLTDLLILFWDCVLVTLDFWNAFCFVKYWWSFKKLFFFLTIKLPHLNWFLKKFYWF